MIPIFSITLQTLVKEEEGNRIPAAYLCSLDNGPKDLSSSPSREFPKFLDVPRGGGGKGDPLPLFNSNKVFSNLL